MWDVLKTALERYGVGTTVMLAVIAAAALAIRELWKRLQELGVEHRKMLDVESEKRRHLREAHEKQVSEMRAEMERRTNDYIDHLNELQEKRIEFGAATTREVMALASEVRDSSRQQTEAITFLRDTIVRRDP